MFHYKDRCLAQCSHKRIQCCTGYLQNKRIQVFPIFAKHIFGFFIPFLNITIFAQTLSKIFLFSFKALKIHCQIKLELKWLCNYISNLVVLINYKSSIAQICGDGCFLVPLFCLWRGEVSNYRMVVGNKGNVSQITFPAVPIASHWLLELFRGSSVPFSVSFCLTNCQGRQIGTLGKFGS